MATQPLLTLAVPAESLRLPQKRKGIAGFKEFFRFRLDLTRTPKRIDLCEWEKDFEDKGEVFEGVYALDGDTLKVCLGGVKENGEKDNRPTVLESKKGSEAILVTLKRKTKTDEKRDRTSPAATTPKAATTSKTAIMPKPEAKPVGTPAAKIVKTREVRLDFTVNKVGPSGLGNADVYITLDKGASWKKMPGEVPIRLARSA